jgi:hypothetical protein
VPPASRVKTETVESWWPSRSSLPRSYLKVLPPTLRRRSLSHPRASVSAESGEVGGGDHGEVEVLGEVMGDAVGAVEPSSAHGARFGLPLSIHQVIKDERAIGLGEQLAETRGAHGRVTRTKIARAFFERIVLNRSALREMAAQLGNPFTLAHELDFGEAKLFTLGQILRRFVGQIGLAKRSANDCVDHGRCLHG